MNFTVDWFSEHITTWERLVVPRLLNRTSRPVYLEIGTYEGRSLCWMLDTIPNLKSIAIDHFPEGGYDNWKLNVGDRATLYHEKSQDALIQPYIQNYIDEIDCIYIDGSHWAKDVLLDTVLAWPLLKSKGIMIWDDYGWIMEEEEVKRPKPAIDAFLTCYRGEYKVLHIGYQFIVEKI